VMALPPLLTQARVSSTLLNSPPMLRSGEEGEDRVGTEGRAKLGDGFATPVGADKGAIDPTERAEFGSGARAVGMVALDDAGPPFR
jgi:hypothetical protein